MKNLSAVIAAVVLAGHALAADAGGQFLVVGEGAPTCGEFSALFNKGDAAGTLKFAAWAHGYASALNESLNGTYNVLGARTLDEFMVDIAIACQADATQTFHAATRATLTAYYPDRTQTAP